MIGVPFNSSTCLMYANMDILNEVGIEEVPKTYEEFEGMAQKILDAGYIPLLQSHSPWIWTENFFSRHNLLMTDGNNGYDAVPTKTLFADTEAFVYHWTKVKEWYEKGYYGYKGRACSSLVAVVTLFIPFFNFSPVINKSFCISKKCFCRNSIIAIIAICHQ